jgi:hypothetical protein
MGIFTCLLGWGASPNNPNSTNYQSGPEYSAGSDDDD